MRYRLVMLLCGLGLLTPWLAHAGDWPTHMDFDNGNELGVKGIFQYDWNRFSHDQLSDGSHVFDDAHDWRRQEVDVYLKNEDAFEVTAGYDFAADAWVDNYVAIDSKAGTFQLGEFRTVVGWEAAQASSANTSFVEESLPLTLIYEGRRAGLGWTYTGLPHFTLQAQLFAPHDLNHNGDGKTLAARIVYAPLATKTHVVHLGISASREDRNSHQAQFKTTPEANLTPIHLVDTGLLTDVSHVQRAGLEGGWMQGPLLLQGEYLTLQASRSQARDFDTHGWYVLADWMLTGESHAYKETAFGMPKPSHPWGAVGLALRYSRVDLDDGQVLGGVEHDWTVGLNWYLSEHFKLQADEVYATTERGNIPVDPHIFELRAQLMF